MSLILTQIRTKEQHDAVAAAAATDSHPVLYPTVMLEKGGEIVGYASVPVSPTVYLWAHSQKMQALDSVRALKKMELIMQAAGQSSMIVPCAKESPFYPNMERQGIERLGDATFFKKELKGE